MRTDNFIIKLNNHLEIISLVNSKMSLIDKSKRLGKPVHKTQAQHKNIYSQLLITRTIPINITNIGNTIKETLEKAIAAQIEGKCIVEGYIKPRSVEVITFSSGLVMSSNVIFEVVIQCQVCSPVEGMLIKCIAKHINKAGIRAEINETPSPVVIFIARDHNYASPLFADVKENDDIKVRVIGQRFELNDKYISIIAEIVDYGEVEKKSTEPLVLRQAQATQAQPQATQVQATQVQATQVQATQVQATQAPIQLTVIEPTLPPKKQATIKVSRKPKIKVNN
jgi:hypothetical protein